MGRDKKGRSVTSTTDRAAIALVSTISHNVEHRHVSTCDGMKAVIITDRRRVAVDDQL